MFDIEKQAMPKRHARTKTKANLPPGCGECRGRPWVNGERGAHRCDCERGQALAAMDRKRAGGAV